MVVRDAIHGFVSLTDQEWVIVDSPAFQRLRGVRQLALTSYVYPGALHTRFEHCIGACHLAGLIADAIGATDEEQRRVRLAALLHDVGHGPFSHVSEDVFEDLAHDAHPQGHVHEKVSAAIVRHHEPIRQAMGDDDAEWVAELLSGTGHGRIRTVWRDIVAGPADVDKLDYLLRDSHHCGVNYGRYDQPKLTESAARVQDGRESYLGFNIDGIHALEEMLLARHHMHRQVYGHKTRLATDLMLRRAMRDGAQCGTLPLAVFSPPADMNESFVEAYLDWDDRRVMDRLVQQGGPPHRDIADALQQRRLVKRVARLEHETLAARMGQARAAYVLSRRFTENREALETVEGMIAEALGVAAHQVYVCREHLGAPLGLPSSAELPSKAILLRPDRDGRPVPFHEASEVFGSVKLHPRQDRLLVYSGLPGGEVDRPGFEARAAAAACAALSEVEEIE